MYDLNNNITYHFGWLIVRCGLHQCASDYLQNNTVVIPFCHTNLYILINILFQKFYIPIFYFYIPTITLHEFDFNNNINYHFDWYQSKGTFTSS